MFTISESTKWTIFDKNGNSIFSTHDKKLVDVCLQALESPNNIKEAANTSANTASTQAAKQSASVHC